MIYTLLIKQKSIICIEGREKGARLLAQGGGMQFYIIGSMGKRSDQICNVIANKAIEVIGTAKNVHIVHGGAQEVKVHPKQIKLI